MVKGLNQNLLANDVNQGNITIIVANVKNPTTVMHQGDENFFVRVLE